MKDETSFFQNVAHSIDGVGAVVYPHAGKSSQSECYEVNSFTAYKNKREGLWGAFTTQKF